MLREEESREIGWWSIGELTSPLLCSGPMNAPAAGCPVRITFIEKMNLTEQSHNSVHQYISQEGEQEEDFVCVFHMGSFRRVVNN